MNILKVVRKVIREPTSFFEKVSRGNNHLGFAFGYYALLSLFGTCMGVVVSLLTITLMSPSLTTNPLFGNFFSLAIAKFSPEWFALKQFATYLLGLILIFLIVGLLHIWIKIFGGKNKYTKTFELFVYSETPPLLFGWIPFLGGICFIWSVILLVIGTQQVHGLSRTKSILIYVIPLVFFFVLMAIFWLFIVSLFGNLSEMNLANFGLVK